MRKVTFTPSSLDRYATNGVQRSVTPEAFSAGTTAKVNSGYLVFHSCAEAAEAVRARAAAPAIIIRRLIMTFPLWLQRNRPIASLQPAAFTHAVLRLRQPCREPEFLNWQNPGPRYPSLRPPQDRTARARYVRSAWRVCHQKQSGRTPCRSDGRSRSVPDRANAGCRSR